MWAVEVNRLHKCIKRKFKTTPCSNSKRGVPHCGILIIQTLAVAELAEGNPMKSWELTKGGKGMGVTGVGEEMV